ncbi:PucR family transcriptional regulator [Candidatus Poriferisodalis sp.]|uniref:PucR family transcriptional regulator n=1 Tax=Candidatus Poriferisodalis sp. TaxID=3101277 RepID=UPI003B597070
MLQSSEQARPLTLRQLLAAGVLGESHVVAGAKGLDSVVADIAVTERCDRTTPISSGLLVVLDASSLAPNSYALDIALRAVRDGSGAGLVAVNAVAAPGLATRRLADRFSTALVEVSTPDVLSMAAAARELLLQPTVRQAAMVSKLLHGLMGTKTVPDTLALVTDVLGRPCSLVEATGAVVAGPDVTVEAGALRQSAFSSPRVGGEGAAGMTCPVIVVPGEPARFWLVCVLDAADEAFMGTGLELMGVASWAVGAYLVRDRLVMERDARHRLALLNEIVGGGELPDETVLAQMATAGWSAAGWVTAFHVEVSGAVDAAWVLVNTDTLGELLSACGIDGPLIERTDGWSGWVSARAEPPVEEYRAMTRRLRDAVTQLTDEAAEVMAHGGVGRPATGLPGLRASLTDARQAATLAGAGGRRVAVRHIDELGIQRIMLGWYGSADFGRVVDAFLAPLAATDADETLLRTLEAYLDCQSSATNTAAVLGVHRNTVMKRIDRISEALHVNLADPDQRLALQLVMRKHRLDRTQQ